MPETAPRQGGRPDRRRPVLFVSADSDLLDMYVLALRSERIGVVSTDSRTQAKLLVEENAVSAVVLDIVSEADWETCRLLCSRLDARVPVIALTGWVTSDGRYREQAFAVGCAAFAAKPITGERLVTIVLQVRAGARGVAFMWEAPDAKLEQRQSLT